MHAFLCLPSRMRRAGRRGSGWRKPPNSPTIVLGAGTRSIEPNCSLVPGLPCLQMAAPPFA
jgi:hypothetical protein